MNVDPHEVPVYHEGRWWTSDQWYQYQKAVSRSGLDQVVTDADREFFANRNKNNPPTVTINGKNINMPARRTEKPAVEF